MFGHVKLQRIGDELFVGHGRGFMQISMSDAANPRVVRELFTDAMRTTHAFSNDEVVFHYYLNDRDAIGYREKNGASADEARAYPQGAGVFRQPLAGAASSIVRVGDFGAYGHDSVTMGDSVLFVSQKGIDVYDRKKAAVVKGPRFSVYWPRIVSCAPHALAAVIETDDRSNYAVRMIDLAKKKPSAGKKLFKKFDAKAWCLEGNRLWLLLGADSKKGERVSLGAVALPECDEVTVRAARGSPMERSRVDARLRRSLHRALRRRRTGVARRLIRAELTRTFCTRFGARSRIPNGACRDTLR
jgi:hypothetical protein